MKLRVLLFVLFLATFSLFAQQNQMQNCYTIAVGKKASYDQKRILLAHNEDDTGGLIVNMHKVKSKNFNKEDSYILIDGTKIPQAHKTNSLIWLETTQQNFGDMFMNEFGVTICSNSCPSREKNAKGILTYDFRKLIAERAKTAKEAIMIASVLLNKYGYASSGRTYTIADANEVWILAVVMGNHWVAQRVPDDEVAIIPNYYTIGEIDLKDTNILASPDIIDYAIQKKWYNPDVDGKFNFREAYSSRTVLHASWNVPRHWIGLKLLSKKEYGFDDSLPFSFKAKTRISIEDLQQILKNHYEDTDLEANKALHKNPHNNMIHTVCNSSTKFSVVANLSTTNPKENKNILWFAPLNPCVFPYIPIYFNIEKFPEMYSNISAEEAISQHFEKEKTSFKANPTQAFSVFNNYSTKINNNYWDNKNLRDNFILEFNKIIIGKLIYGNGESSYDLLQKLYDELK